MFYDEFTALCAEKGISRTKACIDCGVSRTAWHKWENGATPNGATVNKFAVYFGVSVSKLLGEDTKKAPAETGKRSVSDDDIKFALFGGDGEITDAMYDEVRNFAAYVRQREANKKKE